MAKPVSRSFYLSLAALPPCVRDTATLAYLLARLTDTVADSPGAPDPARARLLEALRDDSPSVSALDRGFPESAKPPERALWQAWPSLRSALDISPQGELIREVWGQIIEGQLFDLRRKEQGVESEPLDFAQVLEYSGWVAGSVGEFWTKVLPRSCFRDALPGRETGAADFGQMCAWGRQYGVALQLANICRDRAQDAGRGRAYLREEDFPQAVEKIREGLAAAESYLLRLRGMRVYFATALPARIAAAMLPGLKGKLPRRKVYLLAAGAALRGLLT